MNFSFKINYELSRKTLERVKQNKHSLDTFFRKMTEDFFRNDSMREYLRLQGHTCVNRFCKGFDLYYELKIGKHKCSECGVKWEDSKDELL